MTFVCDASNKLPKFMPDVEEVRADYTDYMGECQAWDAGVGVLQHRLSHCAVIQHVAGAAIDSHDDQIMAARRRLTQDCQIGLRLDAHRSAELGAITVGQRHQFLQDRLLLQAAR